MKLRKLRKISLIGLIVFAFVAAFVGPVANTHAAGSVVKSIFAADGTRESAVTFYDDLSTLPSETGNKGKIPDGTETADMLGEIVLEEGETITDSGFINKFHKKDFLTDFDYGTMIYHTSLRYWKDVDGTLHDATDADDPNAGGYTQFVSPDYNSAVGMDYDLATGQGGKELKYHFTGNKTTNGGYITLYFHYGIHGAASETFLGTKYEIATDGYLGYRVKVQPKVANPQAYSAYLQYDANGGTVAGVTATAAQPFEDVNNTQYSSTNYGMVNIPIYGALPQRDGYSLAFWQNITASLRKDVFYPGDSSQQVEKYHDVASAYTFKNLYDMGASNPTRAILLTAIWDKNYDVKYYADAAKTDLTNIDEGTFGLKLTNNVFSENTADKDTTIKPAAARAGYKFTGWKDEATGTVYQPGDAYTVPNNDPHRVLVAQWAKTQEKTVFKTEDDKTVREDDGDTRQNIPEGYTLVREDTPQVTTATVNGEEVETTTYVVIVKVAAQEVPGDAPTADKPVMERVFYYDENGVEIHTSTEGKDSWKDVEENDANIAEHYTFVEAETSDDGTVSKRFYKVKLPNPPTTDTKPLQIVMYVDEEGKQLHEATNRDEIESVEKNDLSDYEFVREDVSENGNIFTRVYRAKKTPSNTPDTDKPSTSTNDGCVANNTTPSTQSAARKSANLAKTGSNVVALSGMALAVAVTAFVALGVRRYRAE